MGNHGIYGRKTMAGTVFAIGTSAYADTWQQPQNFSVLHKCSMGKNHPIYSGGSTGLTDFFGAIVSPSISQRNCCGVRERTSSGLRGHWKRLSDNLLYNKSHPSPSHTNPLIRSVRRPQKR